MSGTESVRPSRVFWRALRGEAIPPAAWPAVIARAEREGVTPWLAFLHADLPDRDRWRKRAAAEHLRQQLLLDAVRPLCEAVNRPWALVKGLALAHTLYDDPLARGAGDCDVLVRAQDFVLFRERLLAGGFRQSRDHHEQFTSELGTVDLHSGFVSTARVPSRARAVLVEPRWEDSLRRVMTPVGEITTLSETDTLVFLALHLIHHHGLVGSRWLIDIDRLLPRLPDGPNLVARTSRSGALLLALLRHLLHGEAAAAARLGFRDRLVLKAASEGRSLPGIRFLLTCRDLHDSTSRRRFLRETLWPPATVLSHVGGERTASPRLRHLGRLMETAGGLTRLVFTRL